jgi:hypothetical protein
MAAAVGVAGASRRRLRAALDATEAGTLLGRHAGQPTAHPDVGGCPRRAATRLEDSLPGRQVVTAMTSPGPGRSRPPARPTAPLSPRCCARTARCCLPLMTHRVDTSSSHDHPSRRHLEHRRFHQRTRGSGLRPCGCGDVADNGAGAGDGPRTAPYRHRDQPRWPVDPHVSCPDRRVILAAFENALSRVIQVCRAASPLPNRDTCTNTLHQFHCAQRDAGNARPGAPYCADGPASRSALRGCVTRIALRSLTIAQPMTRRRATDQAPDAG